MQKYRQGMAQALSWLVLDLSCVDTCGWARFPQQSVEKNKVGQEHISFRCLVEDEMPASYKGLEKSSHYRWRALSF